MISNSSSTPREFHDARKVIPARDPHARGVAKIIRNEMYLARGERTWVTKVADAVVFPGPREASEFLRRFPAELVGAEVV